MSISLAVGGVVVQLPDDLYWSDELAWHPVGQSATRTVTGALVVQTQVTTGAGRPITLEPPVAGASWITRAALLQLKAWAAVPGQVMALQLHGVARNVIWRLHDGGADVLAARPVMAQAGVDADDAYVATFKLMEI